MHPTATLAAATDEAEFEGSIREEQALTTGALSRGNAAIIQPTLRPKMLVVAGAALGLAFGFGPVFFGAGGLFLKPMALSFAWGRADVALLATFGSVGIAIGAPCIGYVADRIGWSRVIAVSVVVFPLGLLAIAVAPPSHFYIVLVGLLIGIAAAATTAAGYIAAIASVFDRRLGLAFGFATVGIGLGTMATPLVAAKLLEFMSWRQAYACFAGLTLLFGILAHQTIFRAIRSIRRAAEPGKDMRGEPPRDGVGCAEGVPFGQAIGDYRFWLIGLVAAVLLCSAGGATIHFAAYVTDRGISPMMAAQSAGVGGLGTTLARLGVGIILDKVFAPLIACGSLLLGAVGLYLLTTDLLLSPGFLLLAAFLIGVVQGAEGDLLPFMVRKYFGSRAFGSIYGFLFGLLVAGSALGSYVYGLSFDMFNSYAPILQGSALLLCACSVTILALGRYRFAGGGRL